MNQQTAAALEDCQSCQQTGQPAGNDKLGRFTYDEGKGVKDKIVMTGPLSQVFTQALNILFEKKPLQLTNNPPEGEMPVETAPVSSMPAEQASESYSQDHFMEQLVSDMEKTPELDVVLSNFDIKSVQDHLNDVKNQEVPLDPPDVTTVLVTDVNDIVKPSTYEPMVENDFRGVVLVVGDMGGPGPIEPSEEIPVALFADREENQRCIERMFEGTNTKVCFGMEAFAQEMRQRQLSKAGA